MILSKDVVIFGLTNSDYHTIMTWFFKKSAPAGLSFHQPNGSVAIGWRLFVKHFQPTCDYKKNNEI